MKTTLLATAILASLVSGAVSAATVYDADGTKLSIGGRIEVRGLVSDSVDGTMEDISRSRVKFQGETQISESLTGFGVMEYEIKPSTKDGEDFSNRYLFVGLSTQIGDFSYGKQDTANVQVSNLTDIASFHSGQQLSLIEAANDKQSNNFLYAGQFLDNALSLQTNFIANDGEDDAPAGEDAFGVSAVHSLALGLDLGAAYSDQDDQNQVTLGAGYTFDNLYLGVTYAMGELNADDEFTSLELAAQYKVSKQLRLISTYTQAENEIAGVDIDTVDNLAFEAQYRFNKSFRTYASYLLNELDGADDELVAGLRYSF